MKNHAILAVCLRLNFGGHFLAKRHQSVLSLYLEPVPFHSNSSSTHVQLQGYLAHKKQPPPPQDHRRALGIILL